MTNFYGDWEHANKRHHVEDEEDQRFDPDEASSDRKNFKGSRICRRLERTLTDDMALRAFRSSFGRKPRDCEELELFKGELIASAYNAGYKVWAPELLDFD